MAATQFYVDMVETTCWSSNWASEMEKKRWFKWFWMWCRCWRQMGWSEYFINCWSTGISHTQPSPGFTENDRKKGTYPESAVLLRKMPLLQYLKTLIRGLFCHWFGIVWNATKYFSIVANMVCLTICPDSWTLKV